MVRKADSKHLPWVPDRPTVRAILGALGNLKHRALLIMAYDSGLRVSELCRLKPWHIESAPERMLVRVEQGKGRTCRKARVECHGGIHSLRHAFATHLMEDGAPIHLIKRFLGHNALATTAQYCHVTAAMRAKLCSPLDSLYDKE
jgi:site-specific recombinase XerD